jgi:hypothetical protein
MDELIRGVETCADGLAQRRATAKRNIQQIAARHFVLLAVPFVETAAARAAGKRRRASSLNLRLIPQNDIQQ